MSAEPQTVPPGHELQRLIDEEKLHGLERLLATLSPEEVVHGVARLDDDARARLLTMLAPAAAALVVEQIPEVQAADAIELLQPEIAAAILHELPGADRADLLGDVDEPAAEAILEAMEGEEAAATRALREYPDDVAGGLMTLEYLAYSEDKTIAEVLEDIRSNAEEYRDFVVRYVFATARDGRLTGVLRLRDLLFARQDQTVQTLMIPEPLTIAGDAPLDEVRAFFDAHTLFGVPVVDGGGRLLGMLRREAVGPCRCCSERGVVFPGLASILSSSAGSFSC